jgi:hypothetical protein
MATADQLPGNLNIAFNRGDSYATLLDLSINTTGYSWEAEIYSLVTLAVLEEPTVTVVSAANGQINLSITDSQAAALPPGTLGLRISWTAPGEYRRRAFEGICEVHR